MVKVTGTVSACVVRDTSKRAGEKRLKTYLTLAVEATEPSVSLGPTLLLIGDGERRVAVGARVEATTHFDPEHPPASGGGLPLYDLKTFAHTN